MCIIEHTTQYHEGEDVDAQNKGPHLPINATAWLSFPSLGWKGMLCTHMTVHNGLLVAWSAYWWSAQARHSKYEQA